MKTRSIVLASTGLALTAAAAVGGVTHLRANAVADEVAAFEQSMKDGDVRVSSLAHETGLLRSTGRFELSMQPGCDVAEAGAKPLRATVEYELAHFGMPNAPVRFKVSARPLGELGDALKDGLAGRALLVAEGSASRGGPLEAAVSMPELQLREGRTTMKVAAGSGRFALSGSAMKLDWTTDRATVRDEDGAYEVRGVKFGMDLADLKLGTGQAKVEIEHVDTPQLQMEGLSLLSEASVRGDVLDARFAPTVRKVVVEDESLRDVALDVAMKGVHLKSWETLTKLATERCGFQGMTRAETDQAREAVRAMLARGLSIAVTRLAAAGEDGGVKGELELGLEPSGERGTKLPASLATQAFARGRVEVTGRLLDDEQREFVLTSGFASEKGKALVASFDYARGRLTVNGAPDRNGIAEQVQVALAGADAVLAEAIGGAIGEPPRRDAPAAAAPAARRKKVGLFD
ncbi:MAG: hypothetical protein RJA99_2845 [Pseudomonadota bacterium]|jgi:hypothetical protein